MGIWDIVLLLLLDIRVWLVITSFTFFVVAYIFYGSAQRTLRLIRASDLERKRSVEQYNAMLEQLDATKALMENMVSSNLLNEVSIRGLRQQQMMAKLHGTADYNSVIAWFFLSAMETYRFLLDQEGRSPTSTERAVAVTMMDSVFSRKLDEGTTIQSAVGDLVLSLYGVSERNGFLLGQAELDRWDKMWAERLNEQHDGVDESARPARDSGDDTPAGS